LYSAIVSYAGCRGAWNYYYYHSGISYQTGGSSLAMHDAAWTALA